MVDIRELEKELGFEDALAIEGGRIRIHTESRRYGKQVTVLQGFDSQLDLLPVVRELKQFVGAGGTVKDRSIELQGDHRRKVAEWLKAKGFTLA